MGCRELRGGREKCSGKARSQPKTVPEDGSKLAQAEVRERTEPWDSGAPLGLNAPEGRTKWQLLE